MAPVQDEVSRRGEAVNRQQKTNISTDATKTTSIVAVQFKTRDRIEIITITAVLFD